ncbi:hypothetical protein [Falsiroseomonas stagni]|uniref:Uncharacterized protein n=1 Tax=Falsiroseomonas stagni DSM 19981 TaxID=1123062 RepID=A0A1I4BHB4_9PROT|nr:hypothetical protein [Falsiroseomonas stagni]SFK68158.1 hypothetical protein SAMN02745775_105302 [Falsiroseomonas stagni DSM 19981]
MLAAHAVRLREAAGPLLDRLGPDARIMSEFLIEELARLAAQLDAVAQSQREAALTRQERLRIDPLPTIPAARRIAARSPEAAAEEGPVFVEAGTPDFIGFGWYGIEPTEGGVLRWSGQAPWASLLLPALGGGDLVLTVAVRAPFGSGLDMAAEEWVLDGMPLLFETLSNDGVTGLFSARVTLLERPAGSRATLLIRTTPRTDPATGPRRDARALGLGLSWARVERAE